ncbi:MAG: hypothetical protein ACJAZX_000366 [Rickettsiales bacterium]|jgi:hypothetical protein
MKNLKIFILLTLFSGSAFAYETAPYVAIQKLSEDIEIREYETLVLAQVSTIDKEDSAFRVLFKFISGGNEEKQEISMTTPVFQEYSGNKSTMSFVMPKNINLKDLPNPQDDKIKFREMKNQQLIAIRFSGFRSEKNFTNNKNKLIAKIKEEKINADLENPIRATYNGPFTLPFLRRNEVLFHISK